MHHTTADSPYRILQKLVFSGVQQLLPSTYTGPVDAIEFYEQLVTLRPKVKEQILGICPSELELKFEQEARKKASELVNAHLAYRAEKKALEDLNEAVENTQLAELRAKEIPSMSLHLQRELNSAYDYEERMEQRWADALGAKAQSMRVLCNMPQREHRDAA